MDQLFFAFQMSGGAVPYLRFYDELLPKVIYDQVGSFLVSGLCLYIAVSYSVDDGFQEQHKIAPAVVFIKLLSPIVVK